MKPTACAVAIALAAMASSACGSGSAHTAARSSTTLRLPFGLGAMSAQGMRVAVVPAGRSAQLGPEQNLHAVVWDASSGGVEALKMPHICADPSAVALAATEVGVLCDDSCCSSNDQRVSVLRPASAAASVMHVTSGVHYPGGRIDGLAGSGGLIVFNRDHVNGLSRIESSALYVIEGTHARVIATGAAIGKPIAVVGGLVLTEQQQPETAKELSLYETPTVWLRVFRANGERVSHQFDQFPVPAYVPEPPLLFDGSKIYGVGFFSDELSATQPDGAIGQFQCVVGPGVTLGGVSGQFVTYTTADAVHVIQTSTCRDAVLASRGGVPAGAVITHMGVFYAFNSRPTLGMTGAELAHDRSTLTFVPMAKVRAAVSRGLSLAAAH